MSYTWVAVTKDDAKTFIENYSRRLTPNFFMDSYSWHDFTLGPPQDSLVVMADIDYGSPRPCLENS